MKKGFTIMETLISVTLLGLVASFMISAYSFSYKTVAESRDNITNSYIGQEEIESVITYTMGEADRYAKFVRENPPGTPIPSGLNRPTKKVTTMWGGDIDGYPIFHHIKGGENRAKAEVFTFIYSNNRIPLLPNIQFNGTASGKLLPKFQYVELLDQTKSFEYTVTAENPQVLRRAVQREYLTQRAKTAEGRDYILRPYSDYNEENNLVYSGYFPIGYDLISPQAGEVAIAQNPAITKNIGIGYKVLTETKKDDLRDRAYLRTIEAQSINGFVVNQQVANDSSSWFIGTPVISGMLGHWDANLTFNRTALKNSNSLTNNIISHKSNAVFVSGSTEEAKNWKSVLELAGQSNSISMEYLNNPILRIKEGDANSSYRRFSAGVSLENDKRIILKPFAERGSYSIVLRGKPIGNQASLFTVNMDNQRNIINNQRAGNYEANGFFLVQDGDKLKMNYEFIASLSDKNKRRIEPIVNVHSSLYTPVDTLDERNGYHVFELRIINRGTPDNFMMSVVVDGKKEYRVSQWDWSDIDTFGVSIGSNMEISDLLVYNRVLTNSESGTMADYLLKKYLTSEKEIEAMNEKIKLLG